MSDQRVKDYGKQARRTEGWVRLIAIQTALVVAVIGGLWWYTGQHDERIDKILLQRTQDLREQCERNKQDRIDEAKSESAEGEEDLVVAILIRSLARQSPNSSEQLSEVSKAQARASDTHIATATSVSSRIIRCDLAFPLPNSPEISRQVPDREAQREALETP